MLHTALDLLFSQSPFVQTGTAADDKLLARFCYPIDIEGEGSPTVVSPLGSVVPHSYRIGAHGCVCVCVCIYYLVQLLPLILQHVAPTNIWGKSLSGSLVLHSKDRTAMVFVHSNEGQGVQVDTGCKKSEK